MNVLRTVKRSLLATKAMGLSSVVAHSGWRRQRLLILCYHGIAMGDEHVSHPEMFLPPLMFAGRMEILKQAGAHVLGLGEALRLLQRGKLPPRSVVITFDDGWADFKVKAYPILRLYDFPATVYLTTYYCFYNRPIFRFALSYMMWKRRSEAVEGPHISWLPENLSLRTFESRALLLRHIDEYAMRQNLSGKQKDDLAAEFASIIGFDYEAFAADRLFHLMNPEEVTEMARGGVDFQLHTHRHRAPLDRDRFVGEISENRRLIEGLSGGHDRVHFCYPSGAYRADFLPWLREASVESATTCNPGLSTQNSDHLLLPRLLDQVNLTESEFEAWVTGFAAFLPKRKTVALDVTPE